MLCIISSPISFHRQVSCEAVKHNSILFFFFFATNNFEFQSSTINCNYFIIFFLQGRLLRWLKLRRNFCPCFSFLSHLKKMRTIHVIHYQSQDKTRKETLPCLAASRRSLCKSVMKLSLGEKVLRRKGKEMKKGSTNYSSSRIYSHSNTNR